MKELRKKLRKWILKLFAMCEQWSSFGHLLEILDLFKLFLTGFLKKISGYFYFESNIVLEWATKYTGRDVPRVVTFVSDITFLCYTFFLMIYSFHNWKPVSPTSLTHFAQLPILAPLATILCIFMHFFFF